VSIFGPSDQKAYGPYPKGPSHITVTGDVSCRPCYIRFRTPDCRDLKCLESVSVDDVFKAVEGHTKKERADVKR
jgi:ADP-heptose:LPS heptosyltransferase